MLVWPKARGALVDLLPTVDGWFDVTVFDGEPIPAPPSDQLYITVGYVDGDEPLEGDFAQEMSEVDGMRLETGTVRCELVRWIGDDDPAAVRADVMALLDSLDTWTRENQSLGGALGDCPSLVLSGDFLSRKNKGTAIQASLSFVYTARTP